MKRFAAATGHNTATVATSEDEGKLQDRRQNDDAIGFVQNALRNAVGSVENFLYITFG